MVVDSMMMFTLYRERGPRVAKRTNYGFEKRQKEVKRKKKQAAKLEKKLANKEGRPDSSIPMDDTGSAEGDAARIDETTRATHDESTS
jgi:hypothetical protein